MCSENERFPRHCNIAVHYDHQPSSHLSFGTLYLIRIGHHGRQYHRHHHLQDRDHLNRRHPSCQPPPLQSTRPSLYIPPPPPSRIQLGRTVFATALIQTLFSDIERAGHNRTHEHVVLSHHEVVDAPNSSFVVRTTMRHSFGPRTSRPSECPFRGISARWLFTRCGKGTFGSSGAICSVRYFFLRCLRPWPSSSSTFCRARMLGVRRKTPRTSRR